MAILDKTSSSGETWYKVSFRMDGTLVVGYVHGSYVELTKDVITPLPTITSSPTIMSSPTVSSESLSTSSKPTTDTQEESGGSTLSRTVFQIIGIGIVVVVIIVICLHLGTVGAYLPLLWAISWIISFIGYIGFGWSLPFEDFEWSLSLSNCVFIIRVILYVLIFVCIAFDYVDYDILSGGVVTSISGSFIAGILYVADKQSSEYPWAGKILLSFISIGIIAVIAMVIFDNFKGGTGGSSHNGNPYHDLYTCGGAGCC